MSDKKSSTSIIKLPNSTNKREENGPKKTTAEVSRKSKNPKTPVQATAAPEKKPRKSRPASNK